MELEKAIEILSEELYNSKSILKHFDKRGLTSMDITYERTRADALETVLNEVERNLESTG